MNSISLILLGIIGVLFILQLAIPGFTQLLWFNPLQALNQPWLFITSIFLHDPRGFTHIFFNAYALFVFGTVLERIINPRQYLTLFFSAGIIGSLLYYLTYLLGIIPPIPALGASGAIYGILGALAVLLPDMTIFVWFFPMKMRYAAILWVIIEFAGTFDAGSGIGSAAHLGGLLFGLAYAYYLKKKGVDEGFYTRYEPASY
ncbi:rhomboid family intramembrane serine protease [Candidatus Micrarchaeota archaeon]|nr:rhomboid family intramembrane serine protease [Candidatus Micrarchaeota archaeon]